MLPMEKEITKKTLILEGAQALSQLSDLKQFVVEQENVERSNDYLEGAVQNLHFVEDKISGAVEGFFTSNKKRMTFGYHTLSLFGEVPIIYNSEEHVNRLAYAFDPMKKPAILTEDILKRLWNANINRNAVKAFGKLTKKELIEKFESQILSSIK